jgi:DNA-binding MarR family transcriptional regulator
MTDTTALPLTGIDIGLAERATRALLDELLAANDTTFPEWVTLRTLALATSSLRREDLTRGVATGLRVDAAVVTSVGQLEADGLIADRSVSIELTAAGQERYERLQAGVQRIAADLYGDFDRADLVTAGRVLRDVTERANALGGSYR